MSVDVLIAGGGNAALCAAICAARAGAHVRVVEAAPKAMRGGNTRHTRNCRVAHDAGNGILTGPYPVDEYMDDLLRVTDGNTDPELARLTLERSAEIWDFLEAQGVRFQPSLGGTLSLGRTNAFFLGGGRSMLNALCRMAEDLGVDLRYGTRVTGIEIEDGFFLSATTEAGWEGHAPVRERVPARAFVAASGGFEANIDWLREGWGDAAANFRIRGTPYNTGGVLRTMLDAGADRVGTVDQCHAVAVDGRAPQFDGGIVTRLDCVPFGIVVNRDGTRFHDEGEEFWPKRYAIWGRLVAAQPDQVGHVVIDAKPADLFMPSVFPPEVADTIEGLARKIGLDPAALRATVDAFNAACLPGRFDHTIHDDCRTEGLSPPKTHWARPITDPPFRAYTLRPGITFTYMGLRVNRDARVLFGGAPSPNIFAAGEIMAGNVLGQGYLAGIGMTIGTVFGRIAGTQAAGALRNARDGVAS
ncbi:FAD-dependent tricarballylate dehydrogenase TcuA [Jannaschia sp. S6380]|uniref:FAD-dependent tricarballylate dehydrogenase TcuA n=1 Tax=Jannaschia sp. S6380 TaxID=2926408 RepID=UPI001FF64EAD|nr:FAD-dependent tricarballylate dehydrogenase TcuA [Jannaschia sp. S6380]MCK0167217.1 FAD-dependent tricarballylate dehydrogenase TcuA [Jannaschia sp. S6380]